MKSAARDLLVGGGRQAGGLGALDGLGAAAGERGQDLEAVGDQAPADGGAHHAGRDHCNDWIHVIVLLESFVGSILRIRALLRAFGGYPYSAIRTARLSWRNRRRFAATPNRNDSRVPDRLAEIRHDIALASRMLAHENVLDAFGHVSMRHPTDPGPLFPAALALAATGRAGRHPGIHARFGAGEAAVERRCSPSA